MQTDGALGAGDFSLELARQLRYAAPWGQAFPEPMFDGVFAVESWKVVGDSHLRLTLKCDGNAESLTAMMFNAEDYIPPPATLHAVYQLDVDEWNGAQRLRLLIRHMLPDRG